MKKFISIFVILSCLALPLQASDYTYNGQITGTTVIAGLCSFIIWPGIGQAINNSRQEKVVWHAIFGLIDVATRVPIVRLWSGFDALVDRHGGYMDGKL